MFVAVLMVVGTLGVFFGTRDARRPASSSASEPSLRAQLAGGRGEPAVPGAGGLLRGPVRRGGGDARRRALLRRARAARRTRDHLLFVVRGRPGAAGDAALAPGRRARRQAARATWSPRCMLTVGTFALVPRRCCRASAVYALVALIGVGYAGQQLFGLAMLPDCIAYDTARTGKRQAGVFTGLWTAGETFGLALGPGHLRRGAAAVRLRLEHHRRAAPQTSTAEPGCCWASPWCPASSWGWRCCSCARTTSVPTGWPVWLPPAGCGKFA